MAERRLDGTTASSVLARSGPRERLAAARVPLAVGGLALLGGSLLWSVPFPYTMSAVAALLAATALVPRRAVGVRAGLEERDSAHWPDPSVKAVVNALPRPSFVLDSAGVVRFANDQANAVFVSTRPGNPLALTFRSPQIGEALAAAAEGRTSVIEFREGTPAGRTFSVAFKSFRRPGGPDTFLLVTFDDITERLAVARMRSDFVANASHELRTPLASLTGFIETLLGPARNDPEAAERFLRIMLEQATRMRRLIDDLLSLSRLELRVHRRPTDIVELGDVLRHVADALLPLAQGSGVTVALALPKEAAHIVGDRDELIQVFQNLIENAVKYGASGGRVDVRMVADAAARRLRVEVEDYGPGIAAEHIPRLTERFYRIDGAPRGTGLGLAIVKHILARHQGRLDIRSRLGEGTVAAVELALSPAAAFVDADGTPSLSAASRRHN